MLILAAMDNLIEIAFFIIAMLVAFVHWLVKESGIFKKKEPKEDRRQLVEQMDERNRRQQQAPARGPQPVQAAPRRGTPNPDQQAADWRALREALGLPSDAPPPGQSSTPPPFHAPQAQHKHYEDSSDPECDDDVVETAEAARKGMSAYNVLDVFEEETEGPRAKPKAEVAAVKQLFPPLTQSEIDIIQKLRDGVAVADLGTRSASEAAAEHQADSAYDIPDGSIKDSQGRRGVGARTSSRGTISSASIRRLLTSRDGIRQAILAREILGVPKAWQDDSAKTSRH